MNASLLTVDDVAQRLNVTPRFVYRLVHERRITFVKVGAKLRFDESAVDEYVAANTTTGLPNLAPVKLHPRRRAS